MTGPPEWKAIAGSLAALILPVVAAALELLEVFDAGITAEQQAAILKWVGVQIPLYVALAAYRAPHTFRLDLQPPD